MEKTVGTNNDDFAYQKRAFMTKILLLTATIAPRGGTPNLARADPQKRLEDYVIGLRFYLNHLPRTFDHLVFCENSCADISRLRELVAETGQSERVTFFVIDGLDYPAHYDRGYGEFKLIDSAMASVPVLQGKGKIIWKVTGRYIIFNIAPIVSSIGSNFDIACNYRNYPKHWIDTYLIAWTPRIYDRVLKGIYEHLKTNVPEVPYGTSPEELLRNHLDAILNISIKKRFPFTPNVAGKRAADDQDYGSSLNMKYRMRSLLNFVVPWLWV